MYYFDTPMIDTDATAVVVPVNLDAVIKPGTFQWVVAQRLPEEYRAEYVKDCREGVIHTGEPGLYIPDMGPWSGKAVFNLPSLKSDSTVITLPHVMRALWRVVHMLKGDDEQVSLAVGHLKPGELSWDTMEFLLTRFEQDEMAGSNIELWLYPPSAAEDDVAEKANEILCVD